MKVNGLNVDSKAIGAGLYQIICETGREALVAFGMIPKDIVDLLEAQVRRKVIEVAATQLGCTVEEFKPFIDETKVRDTVSPIVRECCSAIYTEAARQGRMVV